MDKNLNLTIGEITLLENKLPKSCTNIELFARGKRGVIFKAESNNKIVIIKVPRPNSDALSTTVLEARYLEKANELNIGPRLYSFSDDYVVMEFIDGVLIKDFFRDESILAEKIFFVLTHIFNQLVDLDKVGINKFELTNPYKHIIIKQNFEPVLIDFERARHTIRVKNVTQFSEYLTSKTILPFLQKKDLLLDVVKFKKGISDYVLSGELNLENIL